ncbi:MAG: hypothetical protein L0Z51_00745 [Candidatus Latescibacteria bacterium]|nr:hypothetical protein [Candidatus Latescibacterota bacterium]
MRQSKSLCAFLVVLAGFALSGCQDAEDVTNPSAEVATEPSPEFMAALTREIESEDDAITKNGDALQATNGSGLGTITGPTVITSPGYYRVANDFSASEDAIVVRSDWVWLDLGHRTITGPGNKAGRGIVLDDVEHVLVSGGDLETFGIGVALLGTTKSCVRRVDVDGGDEFADPGAGNPPQIGILLVNSYRNSVRRNELEGINLGIFVRGGGSFENRIAWNSVIGGANGLLGICYNPAMGEGPAGPQRDVVSANLLCGFGGGIQTSAESVENRFRFNTIRYFSFAYEDFNGSNIFSDNNTAQIATVADCNGGDD